MAINRWSIKDAPGDQHDIEEARDQSEDMVNIESEEAPENTELLKTYLHGSISPNENTGQGPYLHKRLGRNAAHGVATSLSAVPNAWREAKPKALDTRASRGPTGIPFGGYLSNAGYSSPQAALRFQH